MKKVLIGVLIAFAVTAGSCMMLVYLANRPPKLTPEQIRAKEERQKLLDETRRQQGNQLEQLVKEKKIGVGMTTEQVRRAWGKPTSVTKSSSGYESWTYRKTFYTWFLTFEDGVLTKSTSVER